MQQEGISSGVEQIDRTQQMRLARKAALGVRQDRTFPQRIDGHEKGALGENEPGLDMCFMLGALLTLLHPCFCTPLFGQVQLSV